jgi:alanyl-tRNA synthetase
VQQLARDVHQLADRLRASHATLSGGLVERIEGLQNEMKRLRKLEEQQQAQAAAGAVDELLAQVREVAGVPLLAAVVPNLDAKALRTLAETAKAKRASLCLVLGATQDGKVALVAAVSPDLAKRGLSAGALIAKVAPQVGGGGGGRPDFAQAGGKDAAALPGAIASVPALVEAALASGPASA